MNNKNRKLTTVNAAGDFDAAFVNDNGHVRQISKEKMAKVITGEMLDKTAKVGQIIAVEEVDEHGKAVKWKAVDVVASWNDLTDKPFYKEDDVWQEVIPNTAFTIDEETNVYSLVDRIDLVAGKKYKVIWDGNEFECTAFAYAEDDFSVVVLGNKCITDGLTNTGEPFAIMMIPAEFVEEMECSAVVYALVTSGENSGLDYGTHTIRVFENGAVVHCLDPEYIKEMYYTEYVPGYLFPETEIDATWYESPKYIVLEPGKKYTVTYNATEYECIAFGDKDNQVCLGNYSPINGVDSGEPFTILSDRMRSTEDGIDTTHLTIWTKEKPYTISIYGDVATVHTIGERYLPKCIARNLTDGNGVGSLRTAGAEKENDTYKLGPYAAAFGKRTKASAYCAFAEGNVTRAYGDNSHAEGCQTEASGGSSHAEGDMTKASGGSAHAEGSETKANGNSAHAEGEHSIASGRGAHAEGWHTIASGEYSHAEGAYAIASGGGAHAEGGYDAYAPMFEMQTVASGNGSHAEGFNTTASGDYSHSEGLTTTASGYKSHAEGDHTIASTENQHVQGSYNIEDTEHKYLHIIGNGTAFNKRSNAHTVDHKGNAWYAADVYVGGTSQDDASKLATEDFVKEYLGVIENGTY